MSHRRTTIKVFYYSAHLRHEQTQAEALLWRELRAHRLNGIHFRRQHAIGPYIVDFCAPRQKLIIELDGGHHLDQESYDAERTVFLESKGYRVLRFWNSNLTSDLNAVCRAIWEALEQNEES